MTWIARAEAELALLRKQDRWRELRAFDAFGPVGRIDGTELICFASNDYLGLSQHPTVIRAAREAIERYGTGATSSRLIAGTRSLHVELEDTLARICAAERALVFPTGYAANLAVMSTLGAHDVTIYSDALNHASIIDGCRLAKAKTVVYRHRDLDHLDDLMAHAHGPKIIVTDSVFSMDGDAAPVDALAGLCAAHDALLVVDEAHAVLGPTVPDIPGVNVLHVGTLSKTFGALGGWVAGPGTLIDLLINRGRSFIYTTALSPADAAAALAGLRIHKSTEGAALSAQLRRNIDEVRPHHPSPIVPIILGRDGAALEAAAGLRALGLLVPAIRPPTVPQGTARLRIALSAAHTPPMIARLKAGLAELSPIRLSECEHYR